MNMRFNPGLVNKLLGAEIIKLSGAVPSVAIEKIKTKDLVKTINKDLAVPELFQALDAMTQEEQTQLFNDILHEQKEVLIEGNEKFLKKLEELASGGAYPLENKKGEKNDYFAKKRPKFLLMLSEARFFSNISPTELKELEEYTRTLGKLKDAKTWEAVNHQGLITNNEKTMGIISRLEAGNVNNLKNEYQKVVAEVQELLEKKGKEFKKHQFHDVRKNLRFAAYLIKTLNEKLGIPEAEQIYNKYMTISNQLAEVREVTGKGDMSWKEAVKDVLAGINNKSDTEGKSGPSKNAESEVAEIAVNNEFSES